MTSRERVLAAFNHEESDRVPMWCGSSDEFWAKAKRELHLDDEGLRVRFMDNFRRVSAKYIGPDFPLSQGAAGTRSLAVTGRHSGMTRLTCSSGATRRLWRLCVSFPTTPPQH